MTASSHSGKQALWHVQLQHPCWSRVLGTIQLQSSVAASVAASSMLLQSSVQHQLQHHPVAASVAFWINDLRRQHFCCMALCEKKVAWEACQHFVARQMLGDSSMMCRPFFHTDVVLVGGQHAVTDFVPRLQNSNKPATFVLKHLLAWMQFVVVGVCVCVREFCWC